MTTATAVTQKCILLVQTTPLHAGFLLNTVVAPSSWHGQLLSLPTASLGSYHSRPHACGSVSCLSEWSLVPIQKARNYLVSLFLSPLRYSEPSASFLDDLGAAFQLLPLQSQLYTAARLVFVKCKSGHAILSLKFPKASHCSMKSSH